MAYLPRRGPRRFRVPQATPLNPESPISLYFTIISHFRVCFSYPTFQISGFLSFSSSVASSARFKRLSASDLAYFLHLRQRMHTQKYIFNLQQPVLNNTSILLLYFRACLKIISHHLYSLLYEIFAKAFFKLVQTLCRFSNISYFSSTFTFFSRKTISVSTTGKIRPYAHTHADVISCILCDTAPDSGAYTAPKISGHGRRANMAVPAGNFLED